MSNKPLSLIAKFWSRLDDAVHPDDMPIFDAHPEHTFNLKFPPPAFIGAVDTAPIVILMSNGGYASGFTEADFPDEPSVLEYRSFLRGEVTALPRRLSDYYVKGPFARWIADGSAVIVNAVPYRSPKLSSEPHNQRIAKRLTSLQVHRRWMTQEVLPEAKRGRRFVLVHRNGWWKIATEFAGPGPCVLFSDPARAESNRPAPDQEKLDRARDWLRRRSETIERGSP